MKVLIKNILTSPIDIIDLPSIPRIGESIVFSEPYELNEVITSINAKVEDVTYIVGEHRGFLEGVSNDINILLLLKFD